jgi:hypothetical protein
MFGKWKIAIGLVLVVACAAVPAGAAGASPRITC